ncbi:hypothetical protein ACJMK2_029619 [Sinanodonta woodiana]|uniref:Uncharacterized protein n=1 Tax=Sinanodonta woodiana TaxID=1069815 RepID=A0ABD3XEL2_SINWO
MSTFLVTEASCSCTFSTSAQRIKVMTLRAPNYIGCGSAVDIKVGSSGLHIACLMSGTFVDMTRYKEGTLTFSTDQMFYDSNYCLVLEPDQGSSESITIKCIDPYLPTEPTINDDNVPTSIAPRMQTAAPSTIFVVPTSIVTPVKSTTALANSLPRDAVTNATNTKVLLALTVAMDVQPKNQTSTSTSVYTNNTEANTTEMEIASLHTVKTTAVTSIGTSTEAISVAPPLNSSNKEAYIMNRPVSNTERTISILDNVTGSDNETDSVLWTRSLSIDETANNGTSVLVMNVTVQAVSPVISSTSLPEYFTSEKLDSTFEMNITMDIQNETTSPFVAHSVKATSGTKTKGTTSTRYTVASTQPVQSTTYENPRIAANLTMNSTMSREILSPVSEMSHQETTTLSVPSNGPEFASQSSATYTSTIDNANETITMIQNEINITELLQSLTSGEITTHQIPNITDPATDSATKLKVPSTSVSISTEYGVTSVLLITTEVDVATQSHSIDGTSGTTTRTYASSFSESAKTGTMATVDSTTDTSVTNTKTATTAKQTKTTVTLESIVPVKPGEPVKFGIVKVTGGTKQITKVTQKQTTSKSVQVLPVTDTKVNATVFVSDQKDNETFFNRTVNILRYNKLVFIIVAIVIAIVLAVIAGLAISYRRKRNRKATISGRSTMSSHKNMSFDQKSSTDSTGQDLRGQTDAVTILMQNAPKVNPLPDVNHF